MLRNLIVGAGVTMAMAGCVDQELEVSTTEQMLSSSTFLPSGVPIINRSGYGTTISTAPQGRIDLTNEFFQDLGTNGRRCVSCHLPTAGWSITPEQMRSIFDLTEGGELDDGFGLGAVFRTNDGANSPRADVSTLEARRTAYSMLLTKGLIRVGIGMPANAEFELAGVDDPYGFASSQELSLFRRPLPTTNVKFLSAVMWDGRETTGGTVHFDLSTQASHATEGHAVGRVLTDRERESIVAFELTLNTAQVVDFQAADLRTLGATGGPAALITQEFYIGINDNFNDSRTGDPFTPNVFSLYGAWKDRLGTSGTEKRRRSIARGEQLFNTMPLDITGVSGINDEAAFGTPAKLVGTCTSCHNTPNSGNHSVVAPLDIGLSDVSRRTADMPLYTLRCSAVGIQRGACVQGQEIQSTDPGRALISGQWKHINRFKGPVLRGLAARAPFFHNGSAATLADAVEFYNTRFDIRMSVQNKLDLVAFLASL